MIIADTSTWVAFLEGERGRDADLLDRALDEGHVWMAPAVLAEVLSDPELPADVAKSLCSVPLVELKDGFWERAGKLRAKVLAKRRKARLGDALIAQTCIDGGLLLIARDGDFRAFAEIESFDLVLSSVT